MVQSPSWEANWFAASQEIPRISRNPKVHYRTHKRLPTVSILGQPNPVHIPTPHLLEIHRNIIHPSIPRSPQWSLSLRFPHQDPIHPLSSPIRALFPAISFFSIHPNIHPSTPRSPQWSLSLRFPHQDPIHPLSSPIRASCPAHLILLDFITRTILGEQYRSFNSSLCSLLHFPVTSFLLGPNILLNTMFSNTLSFLSYRRVKDQVSNSYETTGKIIVLYILIFKFLDSNLEDKIFCTEW